MFDIADLQTVIFDLDGTLVNTDEANFRAYEEACRGAGIVLTRAVYRAHIGLSGTALVAGLTGLSDPDVLQAVHRRKAEVYPQHFHHARPVVAIVALARRLATSMPLCLATSAARRNADAVLRHFGLEDLFQVVVTRDDVAVPKPHPEAFLLCLERLGGIDPAAALVIEDSAVGAAAARAAGIACLLVSGDEQ